MVGHPSNLKYKDIVSKKILTNCQITINDITNGKSILVPYLVDVREKTVRHNKNRVDMEDYVTIPTYF